MLDFILWIILIYFAFRIISRFLLPYLVKYFFKRFQQKFYQQNPHIHSEKKEGETSVDYKPSKKENRKTNADAIGEYIDYEEINQNN